MKNYGLLHKGMTLLRYLRREKWNIEAGGMAKSMALGSSNLHPHKPDRIGNAAYDPVPADNFTSPCRAYSLINSIAFHPKELMFCATFTTAHKVGIFRIDSSGRIRTLQVLKNPRSLFKGPQHAIFSGDGNEIIVSNWNHEKFTIYQREDSGFYSSKPIARISFPGVLTGYKPHGMELSPSGNFIAICFGATTRHKRGLALFTLDAKKATLELRSFVDEDKLPGVPKGVAFSPDENCLLVTFSDIDSIQIYSIDAISGEICPTPKQIIVGEATQLFRPEDIKLSREGDLLIVSNSEADKITSYPFDKISNRILESTPSHVLQSSNGNIQFPHGIAISPDGSILAVTQFGPLETTADGNIVFFNAVPRQQSRISIHRRREAGAGATWAAPPQNSMS